MGTKAATLSEAVRDDFGWLLQGKAVKVLPDRSYDLAAAKSNGAFLEPYCLDLGTLQSCLQCGACTATCDLAGEEGLFPRRQVTFVRLGLEDRLAADKEIWHCYGCTECSAKCPSGAKPASIMSALRLLATDRYAWPRACVPHRQQTVSLFWLVYLATAALVGVVVATAGSFSPGPGPLRYSGMIPDSALIPIFTFLTVLPMCAVGVGAARAWRAWYGSSLAAIRPRIFWRALRAAIGEILAHKKFTSCKERPLRPWAHRAILLSFVGLAAISGLIALLMAAGRPYPLTMGNPIKVLSNIFAAMLIAGTTYFLLVRLAQAAHGTRSSFSDWVFPLNVLVAGVSGVATEAMRVAGVRAWAYPVYFVHLVVVLVLALTLPYTKLAHAVYRVLAVAGAKYEKLTVPMTLPARGSGPVASSNGAGLPEPDRELPPQADQATFGRPRRLPRARPRRTGGLSRRRDHLGLLRAARLRRAARRGHVLSEPEAARGQRPRAGEGPARGESHCPPAGQVTVAGLLREGGRRTLYLVARERARRQAAP